MDIPVKNINETDTICAISTPHGTGGVAMIRISGTDAMRVVAKIWKGADVEGMKSHTAHLGQILDAHGEVMDDVVATVFHAPNSFTGENVVELSCHGSLWIQQQILGLLVDAGCRLAKPGEFTQRAFLNGRLDLSQAEAVADLISSSSRASHRIAMNQMKGAFSRSLNSLRDELLHFVSLIELELDFSEEDVTFANRNELVALANKIYSSISALAKSYHSGNAIKNGVPVAIVGATNAGKSTLLNALLHEDRAIVSEIRGTTRDVIEDTIQIDGTLFRFIDTAGIRNSSDKIEQMGIERTFAKIKTSDIVLWVIDATAGADELAEFSARLLPCCETQKLIAVINKTDIASPHEAECFVSRNLPKAEVISISAHDAGDVARLQQVISKAAEIPQITSGDSVIVSNIRHYEALTHACEAIDRVRSGLSGGISGDLLSQDIRECMHYLGEITGEITSDDVLGNIFSHFCIGK